MAFHTLAEGSGVMPLSREFKELVVARAERDPDFRKGIIIEAINMILDGEIEAGRIMLSDHIHPKAGPS